jgi:hypothetical protein
MRGWELWDGLGSLFRFRRPTSSASFRGFVGPYCSSFSSLAAHVDALPADTAAAATSGSRAHVDGSSTAASHGTRSSSFRTGAQERPCRQRPDRRRRRPELQKGRGFTNRFYSERFCFIVRLIDKKNLPAAGGGDAGAGEKAVLVPGAEKANAV